MPWRDGDPEGMRIKQEIRHVEPPHSLILSNNSTRDIDDIVIKKTANNTVSPETLSHRLEKGWQHLQECPDPFLNNNNNDLPVDLNDNNNEVSVAEVLPDDMYREMSSSSDDSSSDDESSASFSDTSPLLDVSSLGDEDSDMSEDSSSAAGDSLPDDDNNNDDSWMSFSSSSSAARGVLPDVLPLVPPPNNLEITVKERCLVEITAQPDVQVDIRVAPVVKHHGNTYPREAASRRYLKNRDVSAWIVNDSFDEQHGEDKCTLGEGVRLNNFTVGYKKTLSLTELEEKPDNRRATNAYQNFERNYSKLPANVHMCCKDNWRHQKSFSNSILKPSEASSVVKKYAPSPVKSEAESRTQRVPDESSSSEKNPKQSMSTRTVATSDTNSNKLMQASKLPPKPRDVARKEQYFSSKKKAIDSKLSSPELFEVYTMETALPQINWAAISKGSRENDWIRKDSKPQTPVTKFCALFFSASETK